VQVAGSKVGRSEIQGLSHMGGWIASVPGCRWLVLALCAMALSAPAVGQSVLERIKQRGMVTIGYREDSPPFSFLDQAGNPVGYSLDLCKPIALRLALEAGFAGAPIRYVSVAVNQVVRFVKDGNVDLMCAATSATAQRRELIGFSPSIFVASVKVLVRKEDRFQSLAQLHEKSVAVIDRTTAVKATADYASAHRMSLSIPRSAGPEAALRQLRLGWVAGFARDDVLLAVQVAGLPDAGAFRILPDVLSSEDIAIAYSKDDLQLTHLVLEVMAEQKRSGGWVAAYERWFLKPIPPLNQVLNLPMSQALQDSIRKVM